MAKTNWIIKNHRNRVLNRIWHSFKPKKDLFSVILRWEVLLKFEYSPSSKPAHVWRVFDLVLAIRP